jgi:hypothetical protein
MKYLKEVLIALSVVAPMIACSIVWAYTSFAPANIEERILKMEKKIDDIHWYLIGPPK